MREGFDNKRKTISCDSSQNIIDNSRKNQYKINSLNNVRSKKKNTKRSSNKLLQLVFFFSERTLAVPVDVNVVVHKPFGSVVLTSQWHSFGNMQALTFWFGQSQ